MNNCTRITAVAAVLAIGSAHAQAQLPAAGVPLLDLRLRHEHVTQDNALADANALTLRTRLFYRSADWRAASAFVEFEHTAALVDDYAPETAGRSIVADPQGSEVNQYGLHYSGVPALQATLGRSRLILDNARWVGNVGWRQNEQTFDGLFLDYAVVSGLRARYAGIHNVNTVLGDNADIDAQLFNLAWSTAPALALSIYAYLLDGELPAVSSLDTYGARLSGAFMPGDGPRLRYALEYAQQRAGTAAERYATDYRHAELAATFGPAVISFGQERLGSDGGRFGLQTPLATKHAFQGWADVFLLTPANGVRDTYTGIEATFGSLKLAARYHVFGADAVADDYGEEIDLSASLPLWRGLVGTLKAAHYRADGFAVDTEKLWLQLDYRL